MCAHYYSHCMTTEDKLFGRQPKVLVVFFNISRFEKHPCDFSQLMRQLVFLWLTLSLHCTLYSLYLYTLKGELLHIYEGHISDGAVVVKHVTMKYRYAARYTEFVKQCKERILSALLVWRSSKRASGDSHSSGGLESAASCPLVYSLHSSAHYQPAMFTTFFGDTFPTRGLQLTAASDLINTVGGTYKISCGIHA